MDEAGADRVEGSRAFAVAGSTYDSFMGRYSLALAAPFADVAGVRECGTALDVGCGPGALTGVLVERLGPERVYACDPSPSLREACAARHPGVVVRAGRAEALPYEDASVDHALAQLVLHFVTDPRRAAREMARVVRPGGVVGACAWDFTDGMEMLRRFWDSALSIDPDAPDEARVLRYGRAGEIAALFSSAGLQDVRESTIAVASTYASFDELWTGFLAGVGPAGTYCLSLGEHDRERLREALFGRCGCPRGPFSLGAVARCAVARTPA
ncbi:MAG: class I SAM-dependent methyltransferase [Motilibacteraceae bacterium]